MTTDDERWWDLVDRARQEAGAKEPQARAALLVDWLSRLGVDEMVAFDRFFLERVNGAYRTELWEIAYIMNGGCSDDGFDYFLGWLVSQGKQRYLAALADPRAAAEGVDADDRPFECEEMWGELHHVRSPRRLARAKKRTTTCTPRGCREARSVNRSTRTPWRSAIPRWRRASPRAPRR